jgi:uroporphyrinogen decarboxylase
MSTMTSLERCMAVLRGQKPDRIPVVPQTFMFAAETAGIKVGALAHHPEKMVEAQIVSQTKYGYDGCVIDFDDATLAEACGAKVIFREDEPAIVDESDLALKSLDDVDKLKLPDPNSDGRLPVWLEATRSLVKEIGDRVFVMGRADQGPFDLACLLRGPQHFMMDLMEEENYPKIDRLIDYCLKASVIFAKAQKEAGAHATSIGDSFAGPNLVSPDLYRRFALEPEKKLTAEVQATGIPFSIHICGNTNSIIADMGTTGARLLEVDWQVDMAEARRKVPANTILMGNVNPSDPMVLGNPGQVDAAAKKVIETTGGRGLFLSSGCALGRNTPPENFKALVAAAQKYS